MIEQSAVLSPVAVRRFPFVAALAVFLPVNVLVATALLVLALTRQTTRHVGAGVATAVVLAGLVCHFRYCFQTTHDGWLVLLAVDLLVAGLCWCRPLRNRIT